MRARPRVFYVSTASEDEAPFPTRPSDNAGDAGAGRFGALSSSSHLPYFPRSLDALAWEAAAATVRAVGKGKARLVVQLRLPGISGSGRSRYSSGSFLGLAGLGGGSGSSASGGLGVQQLNVADLFAAGHPGGDLPRGAELDSPLLLLACCKLADELAGLGMPRVRSVQ
jgi:hypothetical protein